MSTQSKITLRGLTEREAVIDAVLRFVQGLDDADEDLIRSSFTKDAMFDLSGISNIGKPYGHIRGRDGIVERLMSTVGKGLDSMHSVSNFRVDIDGDTATLSAYAIAQHYQHGTGVLPLTSKWFLMGNRYVARLKKEEGGLWKIEDFKIECRWADGDLRVLDH